MSTSSDIRAFEGVVSYYETITQNGFLSLFPPGPSQCKYTKPLPQDGSNVFDYPDFQDFEKQLYQFICALVDENFGLKDFIFLMNVYSSEISSKEIYDFYQSLYYKSSIIDKDICVATIASKIDSAYEKKVYLKDTTAPQEALDTFIFLKDEGTIYTILGTKRKSPTMTITFTANRSLSVLEIGLFGSVICGEHLELNEKAEMNSNWFQFLKNREETGRDYFELNKKKVSSSIRGLLEELAFTPDESFTPYIVGKDIIPGRDGRYWKFGKDEKYGYKRPSGSIMIAFVGHCKAPELDEPLDTYECSKGSVVELEYALREFNVDGKLNCAFPSHPRMLQNVTKILPQLF
jgi:hypothetical protein